LAISGWNTQYKKILQDFGYSRKKDYQAAVKLDSILKKPLAAPKLKKMIAAKTVFVIGSGPSLQNSLRVIKKYKNTIKICADSAIKPLVQNGIIPQIVVTDLDGNLQMLRKAGRQSIMVVHAHGDNTDKLEFAKSFKKYIGTTQTNRVGKVCNFGGFTDGDRCVFLASHFGASKIVMLGMDFGPRIGIYSNTKRQDRKVKLKKLRCAKRLLEWLAPQTHSQLFTLSAPLKGFRKITYTELEDVIL
jgi:uncharacterized Rossmann fold enzyme